VASINQLSPNVGPVGTVVTITGTGFGATQGASTLIFNGVTVPVSLWSDTTIKTSVPSGASTGSVVVALGGEVPSNASPFTVTAPLTVSSVSPSTAAPGAQVTITGTGFAATQGTGKVWLGSAYATVVGWSDTQIVATMAPNSTTGTAQVRQGANWSTPRPFTVNTASISPFCQRLPRRERP
jgi:hypothetical protein